MVTVHQGDLIIDRLLVTNDSGALVHDGGTVSVRSAAVANGKVFSVGDGSNSATYRMSGTSSNLHSFSSGLLIASHAVLTGSGTLQGAITNHGTIAPGLSAGGLKIDGSLRLAASARMSFEIGGLIATNQYDEVTVSSFVEFAGTLSLSLIQGFVPDTGDSFTLMRFGSSSGTFANAPDGAVLLTADQKHQFTVTHGSTNLVVGNFQPALILTSIVPGASQVSVRFQFSTGENYEVQYSGNLTNWTPVVGATFTEPQPGIRQWIDDGSWSGGLPATRFYRVRQLP
jgi:hypothetical protein